MNLWHATFRRLLLCSLLTAASVAPLAAQPQWGTWTPDAGAFGDWRWARPRADAATILALTGTPGECVTAQDIGVIYCWAGGVINDWVVQGGGADTDDQTAPEVPYTPAVGANWTDPDPTQVAAALDALAAAPSGTGDVAGPASSTLHGFALFADTTGKLLESIDLVGDELDFGAAIYGGSVLGDSLWLTANTVDGLDEDGGSGSVSAYIKLAGQSDGGIYMRPAPAGVVEIASQNSASYLEIADDAATLQGGDAVNIAAGVHTLELAAATGNVTLTGGGNFVGSLTGPANDLTCTDCIGSTEIATLAPADAGLGSVTNDAQTKAAVVPNTAPAAGQVLVGNAGGTAYAPQTMSGDATLGSTGALTIGSDKVTAGMVAFNYAGSSSEGGAATTATALATNGTNCGAGNYPLGVDASGNAEDCTAAGGGVSDHGALTGLADDDHTQYLLADGTRATTGNFTVGSGLELRLPLENVAATPTLNFGDGDTGIYQQADNIITFGTGGSARFIISGFSFAGASANTFKVDAATASATSPNVGPRAGESTGLGWAATADGRLIANGSSKLSYSNVANNEGIGFLNGNFSADGDARARVLTARNSTTTATPAELFLNGSSTRMALPNDTTWAFDCLVVSRRTDADGESAAYRLVGVIDRQTNAASTALVGTVTQTVLAEDNAAWDATATADTTNGALVITVTHEASKAVRAVSSCRTVEVTG